MLSPQTSARQMLQPVLMQLCTGSIVINAMLPRRHCLKALKKTKTKLFKEHAASQVDGTIHVQGMDVHFRSAVARGSNIQTR